MFQKWATSLHGKIGAHSPSQSKEQNTVKTNSHKHAHTHRLTLYRCQSSCTNHAGVNSVTLGIVPHPTIHLLELSPSQLSIQRHTVSNKSNALSAFRCNRVLCKCITYKTATRPDLKPSTCWGQEWHLHGNKVEHNEDTNAVDKTGYWPLL